MSSCSCCSSSIPDEQNICSMCYGDPCYGSDSYYFEWLEEQYRAEEEKRYNEELQRQYEEQTKI